MHQLVIDWLRFVPALVLLLTPISLFHGPKVRYRAIARDWDRHLPQMLSLGLHAIDLGRAALGSWLLIESLNVMPGTAGALRYMPVALAGALRVLAIFLQTVTCKEPRSANAPFTFAAGLLFGGLSPIAAAFSVSLAVALTTGSRTPIAFFPLLAFLHLVVAFLFGGRGILPGVSFGALAAAVPWLWSILFRRQLVVSYRTKRHAEVRASEPVAR